MSLVEVILIAFGLSADAFAVSLCVGASGFAHELRPRLRLAWNFGFFQFIMPIVGWFAGGFLLKWLESADHWIAFLLLVYVGGKMIYSALSSKDFCPNKNPTKGLQLLMLSVATSIDAFAIGLSLAMINVPVFVPSIIIGIVAAVTSYLGARLGTLLHLYYGKIAEFVGGCVLIFIGLKIVLEHSGVW